MKFDKVLFLAAETSRSKSYAQAMHFNDISIENTVIYSESNDEKESLQDLSSDKKINYNDKFVNDLLIPDLKISLKDTCQNISDKVIHIQSKKVNDEKVVEAIKQIKPKLVIFSGYGGQIVSKDLLEISPFLHIHSGWLPEYRGSTTVYYSIINERECGVSSILLEPKIDTGSIVLRKKFSMPQNATDADHEYDGAIRASVLIDSLNIWQKEKGFSKLIKQDDSKSETYYVIHPVLKHIALLSLST